MRRREFEVRDPKELNDVLDALEWGTLAMVTTQGTLVQVPLNFVRQEGHLYFHGAPAGEKVGVAKENPPASFLVVDPHALLPSTFFDPVNACPATQFFTSVLVKGRVRLVEETEEKARALQALMEKLQPQGGFDPITADNPRYQAALRGVAVLALSMETVTGKFKLGQNLSPETAERIMELLEQRDDPSDRRTVTAMERRRPSQP
jgi:hypothetical protein